MMRPVSDLPRFPLDAESTRRFAFLFTAFILIFEIYVVGVDYSGYFVQLLDGDGLTIFAALSFFTISLCLVYTLVQAALSASSALRAVYFLILSASFAVEYSYQKALGRFSDVFDITLAMATTSTQKFTSIGMYAGLMSAIPCVLLMLLLIFTKSSRRTGFLNLFVISILIVAASVTAWTISVPRFPTLSVYAFYRTNVEFVFSGPFTKGKWASKITGIDLRRNAVEPPTPGPRENRATNNIVFVVDESVRGDHLSLNGYDRETTPFLTELQRKGILYNWGIAAAASTSSQFSYDALITGLMPDDFPDQGEIKTNSSPTVFQYAKAAGYTTWFFDGQMEDLWGGIDDDRNYIDHWSGIQELQQTGRSVFHIDNEIAKRVNMIVSGSRGNFVFVFKHGLHTPYHSNFPPDRAIWQPSYAPFHRFDIPGPERVPEIINAYDNSIRYNLDSFFKDLIDDYDTIPNETTIVYTSDHGQTLAAEGKASHGGSSVAEATVPLFIVGRFSANLDTGYKASHFNILPTLVELMGYPNEGMHAGRRSLSLFQTKAADSRPRYFNPQLAGKVPFESITLPGRR